MIEVPLRNGQFNEPSSAGMIGVLCGITFLGNSDRGKVILQMCKECHFSLTAAPLGR